MHLKMSCGKWWPFCLSLNVSREIDHCFSVLFLYTVYSFDGLLLFYKFPFKKMHLKMSGKWWPSCLDLNVLREIDHCFSLLFSHTVYSFDGLLVFSLLVICTCAYMRRIPRLKQWLLGEKKGVMGVFYKGNNKCRDQSRYAPSQWKTSLRCNDVSLAGRIPRLIPTIGNQNEVIFVHNFLESQIKITKFDEE